MRMCQTNYIIWWYAGNSKKEAKATSVKKKKETEKEKENKNAKQILFDLLLYRTHQNFIDIQKISSIDK